MKVLVACEESQAVCIAFRNKGHEAYSCDIQDCSGGHPEWHIKGDVRGVITEHFDLVVFHPVCTYITNSGVRWLFTEQGRWGKLYEAIDFFNLRLQFNSPRIATENPIPHKYALSKIGKYDQLIQPWMFGHGESKATCLWLHNLPRLKPTILAEGREQKIWKLPPSQNRTKLRSKTYSGIAEAMANQWGDEDNLRKYDSQKAQQLNLFA